MKTPINVMLVDDHAVVRFGFRMLLDATEDIRVVAEAESAEVAYQLIPTAKPDVIVMDVRLPGMDGLKALRLLRDRSVTVPVIIMTAFGSLRIAVDAIDGGAFDYLTKPIDLDKAIAVVRQAVSTPPKSCSAATAAAELDDALIVGSSPKMQEVFRPFHGSKNSNHLGLGLTIAAMLSHQMGIQLGVASENNTTTFWLSCPMA
jgi:DNA-binding NtrC family response regulator